MCNSKESIATETGARNNEGLKRTKGALIQLIDLQDKPLLASVQLLELKEQLSIACHTIVQYPALSFRLGPTYCIVLEETS